jgi:hypothetical protein
MSTVSMERRRATMALRFLRRARQAGEADAAEAVAYLQALADLDIDALEAVCRAVALEPRRAYEPAMPDVGTIRQRAAAWRAERVQSAAIAALPPVQADDDDPRTWEHCRECHDETSGWRIAWCAGEGASALRSFTVPERAGAPRVPCGRGKTHGPHTWAARCQCWGRNPVVAERLGKIAAAQARRSA